VGGTTYYGLKIISARLNRNFQQRKIISWIYSRPWENVSLFWENVSLFKTPKMTRIKKNTS